MTHGLNEAIQGIYILLSIAVLATYWSARGIFRHSTRHVVVTELLAILVAITAADFFQTGMEIILTVPLALFLLFRLLKVSTSPTPMAVGAYASLASMIILARLDAVFLAFLLAVFLAFDPSLRRSMTGQHALALLAGLSPIVLYVGINLACFHTIIPVSGQAKQLRFTHHPSEIVLTWKWLTNYQRLLLPLPLIGIVWLLLTFRRLSVRDRAVLFAVLLFPFVQFGSLSVLSDWPSWPWYFYSVVIASCAALAIFLGNRTCFPIVYAGRAWPITASLGAVIILGAMYLNHHLFRIIELVPRENVLAAEFVRKFSTTHPGRYAMGDRAGVVGAMMDDPIVQTEGLVMDKAFLGHIRRQENLLDVLRHYDARYYVATTGYGAPVTSGCFLATEPILAGPT